MYSDRTDFLDNFPHLSNCVQTTTTGTVTTGTVTTTPATTPVLTNPDFPAGIPLVVFEHRGMVITTCEADLPNCPYHIRKCNIDTNAGVNRGYLDMLCFGNQVLDIKYARYGRGNAGTCCTGDQQAPEFKIV